MKKDSDVSYRKFKVLDYAVACDHPRCSQVVAAGQKVFHARLRLHVYCSPECRERHTRLLVQLQRRENVPSQKKYERDAKLRKKYGLTPEQWDDLYDSQLGRCAICQLPLAETKPHVDHDHATGQVRGILCSTCNVGIGMFKDNPEYLHQAEMYLLGDTGTRSIGEGMGVTTE